MQGRAKVVPPFRFGIVEAGVYRGAYPTLKNFPYLKTLGLTTVISLIPEPPTVDLEDFCVINNISLQHYMGESTGQVPPLSCSPAPTPPTLSPPLSRQSLPRMVCLVD